MKRAYYSARIEDFLKQSSNYILGELTRNNQFDLNDLQRNTWLQEIVIMKNTLSNFREGTIIFEYTIPRIGSRIDVVLLYAGVAYLIEFKCGEYNYQMQSELHLSVSLRSFRSEKVASFVKALLDIDANAKNIYDEVKWHYQIAVTRNLAEAKKWIKQQARGSERFGLIASSGAKRLKSDGIWVQSKCDAVNWFLNGKNDVRSSYYLEDTATEFDIQGLELDWTLLAWDADFRFEGGDFHYYNFNGTKWQNVNSESARKYLKNAYRVLLTRARQGMIIYVPKGDASDRTRPPAYYDQTFDYLVSLGLSEI